MLKFFTTGVACALGLLVAGSAACNVYDPSLSRQLAGTHAVRTLPDAGSFESDVDGGSLDRPTEPKSAPHCGNGILDVNERCDTAIPLGHSGACPDGCSGRSGCIQHVLVGEGCDATCEDVVIHVPVPDDGCCPAGATPDIDDDCVAVCGNGIRERGECCDPPETCVTKDNCVSNDACQIALYVGDPRQCTASCELRPVQACVNGDGCCPPGCAAQGDNDCKPKVVRPTPECDGGCENAPPLPSACQQVHGGNACDACDCQQCQAETLACITGPNRDAGACDAVVSCALMNHCTGLDCYCGPVTGNACNQFPLGPCVAQLTAAAGTGNVYQMIVEGALGSGPIGQALGLLGCRNSKCATECSLRSR